MKLLALDFDGVISDSGPECFVVAARTYAELEPEGRLLARHPVLDRAATPARGEVERDPLYRRFVELMPLGNRAEDFGVGLVALERDVPLPAQADYDALRDAQPAAWLKEFHRRFYGVRGALADADPEGWRLLLGPYPPLLAVLRRRAGDVTLAIATAKDRRSVHALLESYGVADLFDRELVLDKETGVSKTAHLEHLHGKLGVPYPEVTFVDDKVNHLDAVAHLGVRRALAAWGYNGEREERLARERGHLVCTLADFERQLF